MSYLLAGEERATRKLLPHLLNKAHVNRNVVCNSSCACAAEMINRRCSKVSMLSLSFSHLSIYLPPCCLLFPRKYLSLSLSLSLSTHTTYNTFSPSLVSNCRDLPQKESKKNINRTMKDGTESTLHIVTLYSETQDSAKESSYMYYWREKIESHVQVGE